jgi:prevent-host-death family protein
MASAAKALPMAETVSVADAKSNFSSVLSRVEKRRLPVTIVRRGIPVAQIVPIAPPIRKSYYGYMKGTVQEIGDIVGPSGEEWVLSDDGE